MRKSSFTGTLEYQLLSWPTLTALLIWFVVPAALFATVSYGRNNYDSVPAVQSLNETNDTENLMTTTSRGVEEINVFPAGSLFLSILLYSNIVLQLLSLLLLPPLLGTMLSSSSATTTWEMDAQLPLPTHSWVVVLASVLGSVGQLCSLIGGARNKASYLPLWLVLCLFTGPLTLIQAAHWVLLMAAVLIAGSLLTWSIQQCQAVKVSILFRKDKNKCHGKFGNSRKRK